MRNGSRISCGRGINPRFCQFCWKKRIKLLSVATYAPRVLNNSTMRYPKFHIRTIKSPSGKPQEAYRPQHNLSKHILSPPGGGGYLSSLGGGGVYLPCGTPTSWPGQGAPTLGYPPSWPDWGGPTLDMGVCTLGTPVLIWPGGVPTLDGVGGTYLGIPPPPLPVERQTDACENVTFPSYYVRGW